VASAEEPTIVLDGNHAMHTGNDSALPYKVSAGGVLLIDLSKVDLNSPPGVGTANTIHFKSKDIGYFRVPLTGKVVRIDAELAQPLEGSEPFETFKPGQTVIFAVGHDNFDTMTDGKMQFEPVWAGMIHVQ
jgi:hypothetical protein